MKEVYTAKDIAEIMRRCSPEVNSGSIYFLLKQMGDMLIYKNEIEAAFEEMEKEGFPTLVQQIKEFLNEEEPEKQPGDNFWDEDLDDLLEKEKEKGE